MSDFSVAGIDWTWAAWALGAVLAVGLLAGAVVTVTSLFTNDPLFTLLQRVAWRSDKPAGNGDEPKPDEAPSRRRPALVGVGEDASVKGLRLEGNTVTGEADLLSVQGELTDATLVANRHLDGGDDLQGQEEGEPRAPTIEPQDDDPGWAVRQQRNEARKQLAESDRPMPVSVSAQSSSGGRGLLLRITNHSAVNDFEVRLDSIKGVSPGKNQFPLELPVALPWGSSNTPIAPNLRNHRLEKLLPGGTSTTLLIGLYTRQSSPPHNLMQLFGVELYNGWMYVHGDYDPSPSFTFAVTVLSVDNPPHTQSFVGLCVDRVLSAHAYGDGDDPIDVAIKLLAEHRWVDGRHQGRSALEMVFSHRREFLKGAGEKAYSEGLLQVVTLAEIIERERVPISYPDGYTRYGYTYRLNETGRALIRSIESERPQPSPPVPDTAADLPSPEHETSP